MVALLLNGCFIILYKKTQYCVNVESQTTINQKEITLLRLHKYELNAVYFCQQVTEKIYHISCAISKQFERIRTYNFSPTYISHHCFIQCSRKLHDLTFLIENRIQINIIQIPIIHRIDMLKQRINENYYILHSVSKRV